MYFECAYKAGGVVRGKEERAARFTVVNSFRCDIPLAKPSDALIHTHMTESYILEKNKKRKGRSITP